MRRSDLRAFVMVSAVAVSALLTACGGPASSGGDGSPGPPELTDDVIRERINGVRVNDIPEENGNGQPITWRFFEQEPKEIVVVEKQMNGPRATVILDVKTRSTPRAREPRELAGQVRTEWVLESGMFLRQWQVERTENISMKYKNLPKPADQNANTANNSNNNNNAANANAAATGQPRP